LQSGASIIFKKAEGCGDATNYKARYPAMGVALKASGRTLVSVAAGPRTWGTITSETFRFIQCGWLQCMAAQLHGYGSDDGVAAGHNRALWKVQRRPFSLGRIRPFP
jgi:hypothetical protein